MQVRECASLNNLNEPTYLSSLYIFGPREGVIIKLPLNGLFNDVVTIIITSRTDVREMNDDNEDDVQSLLVVFNC